MFIKTSGIVFNKSEIEKTLSKKRKSSSFWPVSYIQKKENQIKREPKRENIQITGSVLRKEENNE